MNRMMKAVLTLLVLMMLPTLSLADAPVLLVDLPDGAQMIENVEFDNGDFIQTYQLDNGVTVQLLRYEGFEMSMEELIVSDWPINCGVQLQATTEISGFPAQHARVYQAVDAEGYPVKADGEENGVMSIDLVLVNADGTALICQSIADIGADTQEITALIESLQVQGGDNAEVG